ncbi:MAG TPA: PQQ-binding-like beta-propeller repeat protein [Candidatus Saccharimonadales bacterium]|nr:PQQ-binding-like beta-propeller repeat protein [Candidatus Saccharimonadales bacterium]
MNRTFQTLLLTLSLSTPLLADDWPQWRGPQRNGVSKETGLLKDWPAAGPKLAWKVTDAGSGYSTPSVVGDRLYLLENKDLENETVVARSANDGKQIWSARLGNVGNPKQQPSFPAARSTPTVDGQSLYALGSDGDLACIDLPAGTIRWHKNLRTDFGGKPGEWAYSESPLVDGNTVLCTPGGAEATLVALNKKTGDVLWKCATPDGDRAAFASAMVVQAGGVKQYVQLLEKGLVGVDPASGKLLWRYAKPTSRYGANIPSPVAKGDIIYVGSAGTGGGAVKVKSAGDKVEAEQLYFDNKLPTAIGGAIIVGDSVYGTTAKSMSCFDLTSGKVRWEESALGAASLCYADGRLYLHGENGEAALVEATPDGYKPHGKFTPPDQPKRKQAMEKAWAYPVVANGKLYLRDHGSIWCYEVK